MEPYSMSGGCQCGAVRFAFDAPPENVHVCHCRMCQKAVGGPFAVICPVLKSSFRVTRGAFSWFRSSDLARRGFCSNCGTPMIFDYPDFPDIGVLVGALDQPGCVPPVVQYGIESRVPWYGYLPDLPGDKPTYSEDPMGFLPRITASNRQHPDHDTEHWVPRPADR
ncbi:GFA family protein [Youhaiella tibetensis]|uniref:GFA family protein n=2 Tax=Paradevosia tibetensis TaxID=1447062 RepID=A0A5B9DHD9_9HYPH|nr:GFA family protein [Youhaiella tibetensis]QEE18721.1 GFA family protein [Youhaiella tibetensis]